MIPPPLLSLLDDQLIQARAAQAAWSRLTVRQRLPLIRAFRHLLVSECDRLCAAVARDVGKPAEETLACEILPLADACRFVERQATRLLRPRPRGLRPLWLFGE